MEPTIEEQQIEYDIKHDKTSQRFPRLAKIQTLTQRINENIYIPKNKALMLSLLRQLELLIESAIDGNKNAIDYLNKRQIPQHKQIFFDEEGNVFAVYGILQKTLNYRYGQHTDKYKGSPKMCHFLQSFNGFLKTNCGLKQANIKFVGKYDYDLLLRINSNPNYTNLTQEEQKIYNLIYNKR